MSFQYFVIAIFTIAPLITSNLLIPITILSDLSNDNDITFFKQTLPWIVDNIGSDIKIYYHFKDSGKNSGPRKCVLSQLTMNTYLQATFLSCEANEKPLSECIKSLPLNLRVLNTCIKLKVNYFVKAADRNFRRYNISITPAIILPKGQIISNGKPEDILKGICLFYPINKPLGCVKPNPLLPTKKSQTDKEDPNQPDKNEASAKKTSEEEKDKTSHNESEVTKNETENQEKDLSAKKESSEQKVNQEEHKTSTEKFNKNEVPKEDKEPENKQYSDENSIKVKDN